MSNLSDITASLIAVAGTIGAAIAFVWNKVEQRFKEIENQLLECDKRERECLVQNATLIERVNSLEDRINLLITSVESSKVGDFGARNKVRKKAA